LAFIPDLKPHIAANIAIAEYFDSQGNTAYVMRVSLNSSASDKHSERLIFEFLGIDFNKNPIKPTNNVTHWFSELQPCNKTGYNCRKYIGDITPNAKVDFIFQYPNEYKSHLKPFFDKIFTQL
jgi:Xanthomonas XOO_2897-like deaminase